MPLYDYQCKACGPFSAFRKMSESSLPHLCESCGDMAIRVVSAPHFAILGAAQRQAYERNEKSAHEPKALRRSSCGCSGSHTCKPGPDKGADKAKTAKAASGQDAVAFQRQTKKTARPWMLGH